METKKLTEEELNEIKALSDDFNQTFLNLGIIQTQIAELEARRDEIYEVLSNLKGLERQIFVKLKEKYGEGSVDLKTGEFKNQN